MRLQGRGSRIRGVTGVSKVGLQRQLLLAKALQEKSCSAESAEVAVRARVQQKNGWGWCVVVDVCDIKVR
jgi:hypothetical protein